MHQRVQGKWRQLDEEKICFSSNKQVVLQCTHTHTHTHTPHAATQPQNRWYVEISSAQRAQRDGRVITWSRRNRSNIYWKWWPVRLQLSTYRTQRGGQWSQSYLQCVLGEWLRLEDIHYWPGSDREGLQSRALVLDCLDVLSPCISLTTPNTRLYSTALGTNVSLCGSECPSSATGETG